MKRALFAGVLCVLVAAGAWSVRAQAPAAKKGMIYQPGTGAFWDPTVIYARAANPIVTVAGAKDSLLNTRLIVEGQIHAKATGRIGFISQESEVTFSNLKFYSMSL